MTKPDQDRKRLDVRRRRETANLFSRVSATYAASRSQAQRLLKAGGGLSIVEWRILWDVLEAGPITVRELADLQKSDHSLISRILPKMVKSGLITLTRDTKDGRQTLVDLTQQGIAAYEKAAPVMAKRRAALLKHFSKEEIDQWVAYLDRFDHFCRLSVDEILDTD
ncbi:MAG: MarR family transcriptional regulator [Rhodobacteraceae bacterium]|jgi:DNA-binding MarR family transcriptional regulator|nr:MarR family transcriptional regulator [Paracoccaceae bacterium]